jgi:outer membrane protein assembly factor BamB
MKTAHRKTGVLVGCLLLLGAAGAAAQDWPQWRGPNRDSKIVGFTAPSAWPKTLTQKWSATVGVGESSPLLVGDRVYAFGRIGGDEVTTCLDATTGKIVWQDKYASDPPTGAAGRHPGTRSTPALADGKLCTLGARGIVSCLDAATGKVLWRKNTNAYPKFFTSSSPLIADGKCVVFVGGLTAFDLASGEVKWRWTGGEAPYGSPVLATLGGTKQVVTPTFGSIAGVRLDDGKLLWRFKFGGTAYQSTYSTPLIDGSTVIYSAAAGKKGGGAGGTVAFKVDKQGDEFTTKEVWRKSQSPYQYNTPVLRDGLIFGLSSGRSFYCADAKTGDVLWTDKSKRGECGAVLNAGPVILALTGDAELVAFQPSGSAFEEVARYKVSATPGLAYPIVAGNRVFVKGKDTLTLWTIN